MKTKQLDKQSFETLIWEIQQTISRMDQLIKKYEKLLSVCLLEDTGHWVQQEKPAEVNKFILDFLSRL